MDREPVIGECITIVRNSGDHGGRIGERFTVSQVDDTDCTVRGIPAGFSAACDYWIPWSDIEPVAYGWEFVRQHLPADVARLLGACDGVEHLALNRQIKDVIFASLPDWRQRAMEAIESFDTATS